MTTPNDHDNEERPTSSPTPPSPEAMEWLARQDPELASRVQAINDGTCHDGHRFDVEPWIPRQLTELEVASIPLDVCSWGARTLNPCLIHFDELPHTHRHLDPRPWTGPNYEELYEGEVRRHIPATLKAEIDESRDIVSAAMGIVRDLAQTFPFTAQARSEKQPDGNHFIVFDIVCLVCRGTGKGVDPSDVYGVEHSPRCVLKRAQDITGRANEIISETTDRG